MYEYYKISISKDQNLNIGLSRFSLANPLFANALHIYGGMLALSRADGPAADGPGCFSFLGLELRGRQLAVR
jgi:hypothetical protein